MSSLLAGVVGGLVAAALLVLPAADASTESEAERLSHAYAGILVRELRTDRAALDVVRDSVVGEHTVALLWIDWIDQRRVAPSHTLMEALQDLAEPTHFFPRHRVVGELERRGHWSAVPDPSLREDLDRYHVLAERFDEIGAAEVLLLRHHLTVVLEPDEWNWMFGVPAEDPGLVTFRDTVRFFANVESRAKVRLVAIALAARLSLIDEMIELNGVLEDRVRTWRDAA